MGFNIHFDSCSVRDGYGFLVEWWKGLEERVDSEVGNAEKTFLKKVDALLEVLCIAVFGLFGAFLKRR